MRIYDVAGWGFWVLGACGAVGWLIVGAPGPAMISALSGAATGVAFFGLGEIIGHLAGIRSALQPDVPVATVAQTDLESAVQRETVVRTPEEVSADIARMMSEVSSRKA